MVSMNSEDLERLDRETSLRLLASVSVGHIAWSDAQRVVIYPLNFVVDDDDIILSTSSAALREAAARGVTLSFQADDFEPAIRTGWTVLVSGRLSEITEPAQILRLGKLVSAWRQGKDPRLLRLRVDYIAGRRLPTPTGVIESVFVDE
jgi:nitroimidazol reductase NimA-like FMN-containing flavoprotein (pyridoxamine 5'-phosphate oxidase superfamily)